MAIHRLVEKVLSFLEVILHITFFGVDNIIAHYPFSNILCTLCAVCSTKRNQPSLTKLVGPTTLQVLSCTPYIWLGSRPVLQREWVREAHSPDDRSRLKDHSHSLQSRTCKLQPVSQTVTSLSRPCSACHKYYSQALSKKEKDAALVDNEVE